jgi:hypothetical protein
VAPCGTTLSAKSVGRDEVLVVDEWCWEDDAPSFDVDCGCLKETRNKDK